MHNEDVMDSVKGRRHLTASTSCRLGWRHHRPTENVLSKEELRARVETALAYQR